MAIRSLKQCHKETTSHHLLALRSCKRVSFPSKLGGRDYCRQPQASMALKLDISEERPSPSFVKQG